MVMCGLTRSNTIDRYEYRLQMIVDVFWKHYTSFDSTSYFRKAWLRFGQNYLSPKGSWYSAIRITYFTNKNLLGKDKQINIYRTKLEELESNAYDALLRSQERKIDLYDALKYVMEYDRPLIRSSNEDKNLERRYEITLKNRPWEGCECDNSKK